MGLCEALDLVLACAEKRREELKDAYDKTGDNGESVTVLDQAMRIVRSLQEVEAARAKG